MITEKQITHSSNRFGAGSHDSRRSTLDTDKEKWLQKYASRILMVWSQWQTPLGISPAYTERIHMDLVWFYDEPLRKCLLKQTISAA